MLGENRVLFKTVEGGTAKGGLIAVAKPGAKESAQRPLTNETEQRDVEAPESAPETLKMERKVEVL